MCCKGFICKSSLYDVESSCIETEGLFPVDQWALLALSGQLAGFAQEEGSVRTEVHVSTDLMLSAT